MNKVVHFELPARDFNRAKKFYSDIFGWQISDYPAGDSLYALAQTTPGDDSGPTVPGGINGGIMEFDPTRPATVITIDVPDISRTFEQITAAGGKILTEIMPVGDMGSVAYFQDPEGNVVGLWQTTQKS
ncbi:MAG TPA: VOC family protein [Patescibacteria group bacterium]